MSPPKLPNFLTLEQIAERLQVCPRTLTRAIERGDLHAHRLGRQIRISEDDAAAFMAVRRR
jgi:excisionase family DNA binding protein